eukprot:1152232-Pelagomonas_calceolata.AAC.2
MACWASSKPSNQTIQTKVGSHCSLEGQVSCNLTKAACLASQNTRCSPLQTGSVCSCGVQAVKLKTWMSTIGFAEGMQGR